MDSINLTIPSLPENIRIVESFIDNAKDKYALNDDIYGNIMIAVTESVNNAIKHGNKSVKQKNVNLGLDFYENMIRFTIQDEGVGFDYTSLNDPTAPENIDKPDGRGVFLMRNLCDEVNFENEGSTVVLSFYIS